MTFESTLRAAGLSPREVAPDGKWRRCTTTTHPKKKNGAYILFPDGHGMWRDWANDAGLNHWREDSTRPPTAEQQARMAARMKALRDKERAERVAGVRAARELWASASPYRHHKYLADKGLSADGCAGLRTWTGTVWVDVGQRIHATWLLAPLYFRKNLVNVQRISPDGVKRQMKSAPQKACHLTLDRPRAAVTVFCEGLATGLAVYQCMRHARVVVAFFADNLVPVAQEIKPSGMVVVAGDNDHETMRKRGFNPGADKARNAADLIGCGAALPDGIEGSDWADALSEWGGLAAKKIERLIMAQAKYVRL